MLYTILTFQVPVGYEEIVKGYVLEAVAIKIREDKQKEAISIVVSDIEADIEDFKAKNI